MTLDDLATGARIGRLTVGPRGGRRFLATGSPTLGWTVVDAPAGWRQVATQVRIVQAGSTSTVTVPGPGSVAVPWPGTALGPWQQAHVRVRALGEDERWTPWSDDAEVATGPLSPEDVVAELVTVDPDASAPVAPDDLRPTDRIATTVHVRPGLLRALLTATAHGVYEPVVNGVVASDEVLAPGWTTYDGRLLLQTTEVTELLRPGTNVVGAEVADGWYRELMGFDGDVRPAYPGPRALLLQLRLEYEDGTVETVGTDGSWVGTSTGPTLSASIYRGETRDERLADRGLAEVRDGHPALPDRRPVSVLTSDRGRYRPASAPPVRRIESREPVATEVRPDGTVRIDLGQNGVGWLEVEARLAEGRTLTLRHAEVLEDDELCVRPLRLAVATDRVTAGPDGHVRFAPRFTFHGFRYAEISGLADPADLLGVRMVVVHSDMVRTGWWSSSDPLLDRLHRNVVEGMRSNFLSIPTDCPQRDERLGWTGDIQVFAPTATFLYDSDELLASWLEDLAIEQARRDGVVPTIVPAPVDAGPALPAAAWGDAAVVVPLAAWRASGSTEVLERQYPSIVAWARTILAAAGDDGLWEGGFQFGDWLDPTAPPHNPADAEADPDVVATASLFRVLRATADAARAIGREDDAREWDALASRTRAAFLDRYVTPDGRIVSDAQTCYAVAIVYGLLDGDPRRAAAGDRLARLVSSHGHRIRTGFVGTPIICDALCLTGHRDTAHRLLTQRASPSWLHPVTLGATTVWERWDSLLPDGSVNPGEMTSFNHYALGAVADWMHRDLGGLVPLEPGYRRFRVAPHPGAGLRWVSTRLDSPYGLVEVAWRLEEDHLVVDVVVPTGATALLEVVGAPEELEHGTHRRTYPWTPEPEPEQRSITLDTPLDVLEQDAEAAALVQGVFGRTGYFIGLGWTDGGKWRDDFTLRNSLPMMKPHQYAALSDALDDLNRARGHEPEAVPDRWELLGM